jgi:hypothetical protein
MGWLCVFDQFSGLVGCKIQADQGWWGVISNRQIGEGSAMGGLGCEFWESVPVRAAASRDVSRSGGGGLIGLELPSVFRLIKVNQDW